MAIPLYPKRPDLPTLCKYVSAVDGKSKLMTTLTAGTSKPLVNKSELTKHLPYPFLKLWNTLFLSFYSILECI